MIRIGEFARLGGVSVAMLRHYDELGLLKPNAVDEESGYRLYSVRQLPLLHQITGLRDLDCSLAQIAAYLSTDSSEVHLQALLHQKSAQLEVRISEETARLARVRQRIAHLKRGVPMYTVQLKSVPAQLVASVRNPQLEAKTPEGWRSIAAYYDTLNAHLKQHLEERDLKLPQTNLWHDASRNNETPEAEVTQFLEHTIPESGAVRVYELPALPTAASLIFEGRYDDEPMTDAFTALYRWAEDNGYRIAGPTRQAFLKSLPEPETFQIELQVPLRKA
jgi:DNA-binding transcriptional MerR regulator